MSDKPLDKLPASPGEDARWSNSTVVLYERQIAFLQQFTKDIEQRTGHIISKGELVRAMIDALIWSGVDETLIAALYGSSSDEALSSIEITSPNQSIRSSADLLRDILVEILKDDM